MKTGRQPLTNHARRPRGDWPRPQLRAPGGQLRCQRGDWVIGHRDDSRERLHRTALDRWTTGPLGVSGTHPQGPSGSIQVHELTGSEGRKMRRGRGRQTRREGHQRAARRVRVRVRVRSRPPPGQTSLCQVPGRALPPLQGTAPLSANALQLEGWRQIPVASRLALSMQTPSSQLPTNAHQLATPFASNNRAAPRRHGVAVMASMFGFHCSRS